MMKSMNENQAFDDAPDYVEQVVRQATEQALRVHGKRSWAWRPAWGKVAAVAASAAAVVALVMAVGGGQDGEERLQQPLAQAAVKESPLDSFLEQITDEEAQHLSCYELEEIPEY